MTVASSTVGVELPGGRGARLPLLLQPLPAELEDGVRVEAVERAQADHRVVLLAADRPVVRAVGERPLQPRGVELDGDLGRLARALEAALFGRRQDVDAGRDELVEEGRQLARGLDLDPLPEPDLRDGRAGLRFLEVGRGGLEPAGDRVESLGEQRVVPGEQQEEAVADVVEGERAALPEAQDVGIEDRAADVVELELALEARLVGERRPGSIASTAARCSRSAASSARTASRLPSPSRSSSWWSPSEVPRTGLSRTSRTKRDSTRS